MSAGILGVDRGPLFEELFDDSITQFEFHTHTPYASTRYGNNDAIRILMHQQDVFTLPSESFLYVEGVLFIPGGVTDAVNIKLVNNAVAFLFEEILYELAGVQVDRTKNDRITTKLKNLLSTNGRDGKTLSNIGWLSLSVETHDVTDFNCCVPLKMLLGFAEDYTRIVMNVKQELVLLRTSTDTNAYVTSGGVNAVGSLKLTKVC